MRYVDNNNIVKTLYQRRKNSWVIVSFTCYYCNKKLSKKHNHIDVCSVINKKIDLQEQYNASTKNH